jgi:hypothetical protein
VDIPEYLLQHEVLIEAAAGTSGFGVTLYGPAVAEACFVEDKRRLVRSATTGDEQVSEATVYLRLDADAPPESRVTLPSGRTATVINAWRRDGGDLPVPSHLELATT